MKRNRRKMKRKRRKRRMRNMRRRNKKRRRKSGIRCALIRSPNLDSRLALCHMTRPGHTHTDHCPGTEQP
jgi:hypothetical protein